jgi:hypothetical protein
MRRALIVLAAFLPGCVHVHQQDLDAWQGQPVSKLDKHPFFLTVPHSKTLASDGTEIRDYVNGGNVSMCSGGSLVTGGVAMASVESSTSCSTALRACHNIFYIKNGIVERYSPTGSGGVQCTTGEITRPDYIVTGVR